MVARPHWEGRFALVPAADRLAVAGTLSWAVMVASCVWARGPCRVAVKGMSMAPTLLPGDHVLVAATRRLRRGDLVVVRDPTEPERWVVKRVAALGGEEVRTGGEILRAAEGEIVVLGDNPDRSTDSRHHGPVPLDGVHGRVWYRYAPTPRAGMIPRRHG